MTWPNFANRQRTTSVSKQLRRCSPLSMHAFLLPWCFTSTETILRLIRAGKGMPWERTFLSSRPCQPHLYFVTRLLQAALCLDPLFLEYPLSSHMISEALKGPALRTSSELRGCVKVEIAILGSFPVSNKPDGFCERKATLEQTNSGAEWKNMWTSWAPRP